MLFGNIKRKGSNPSVSRKIKGIIIMILIDKTELKDKIEQYCQPCRKSKNFDSLDCFDCKAHSIINIIDSIEEHTELVPKERYDKLVQLCASHIDSCPHKVCPDIDFTDYDWGCTDDSWECEDCWREFLRKKFI